jgi:GntR family transcriptional regulator/MocR family aminotransferase
MSRRPRHSTFQAVSIDPRSDKPLHRQLYDEVRAAILSGRLAPGSRLPASREMAALSRVSRNTVMLAFEQLRAEGYITGRLGSGTFVAEALPESANVPGPPREAPALRIAGGRRPLSQRGERIARVRFAPVEEPVTGNAFRSGLPAFEHFPFELWRQVLNRRLASRTSRSLTYDDPCGQIRLREAIAAHLSEARGAHCAPEQILITMGAQQALDLSVRVLLNPGDAVLMEDPGYFAARALFEAEGARLVPVPVDRDGMDVEAGIAAEPNARLAYVTPSHQHPMGVMLSLPRRLALLAWAERAGSWVLEDDYASEYRYSGRPLAALQGIDPHQRVLYVGTFSKTLFASLRMGYLVAPPDLVPVLSTARALADRQPPAMAQLVLTEFINEGHYARHLRRMRKLYAERQQMMIEILTREADGRIEVHPADAGMNLVGWLPPGVDDRAVYEAAARRGVVAMPVSGYALRPQSRGGLVLGYTGVDRAQMEDGVRKLVEAVREVMGAGARAS